MLFRSAVVIPIAGLSFSFNGAYTDTNIDKVQVPPIGGLTLTRSQITRYAPRFSSTVAANWVLPVRPFDSALVLNSDWFNTSKFGAQYGKYLAAYDVRSEAHTSELLSLMRISSAVFCMKNIFISKDHILTF